MPSAATPQFDNETKPVDRERPFHRIHSKSFDTSSSKKPDGQGLKCGCNEPDDFKEITDTELTDLLGTSGVVNTLLGALLGPGLDQLLGLLDHIPGLNVAALLVEVVRDIAKDIANKLLPKAARAMPQWAPVNKDSRNDLVDAAQVVEVEGFVTRSYQNAIDVPFFQWHRWYNWSLHIRPESGYEFVEADTKNPPNTVDEDGDDKDKNDRPIIQTGSMECQWDCGALWADQSIYDSGIPENDINSKGAQKTAHACGPMFQFDWAWPVAGQYGWAAGRWVYNCAQSTTRDKGAKMNTMLNPCKAVASARWEAFKFPENDARVPAIQFMFFACKRGGYIDHAGIDDTDYEFIVDLPDLGPQRTAPFPIGHTAVFPDDNPPRFPHNTIVVRPRLLKHFNTGVFHVAGGGDTPPIVEVIPPDDASQPPKQVKVTIPLTKMKGAEAYGVIISLGWHDPLNAQAAKVRDCLMDFVGITDRKERRDEPAQDAKLFIDKFFDVLADKLSNALVPGGLSNIPIIGPIIQNAVSAGIKFVLSGLDAVINLAINALETEKEEWLVRVGVNGRWAVVYRSVNFSDEIQIDKNFDVFLGPQDRLYIAVNGTEVDTIGDRFWKPKNNRLFKFDSKDIVWADIVKADKDKRRKMILQYVASLIGTLGNESEPIGFLDPKIDGGLKITDYSYGRIDGAKNPLWMDEQAHSFGENAKDVVVLGSPTPLSMTTNFAHDVGGAQCVYVENSPKPDYVLRYEITMTNQVPDS